MAGPLEGQPALIHASRGSSGRQRQGQQELPTGGGVMATLPPGHQSSWKGHWGGVCLGPLRSAAQPHSSVYTWGAVPSESWLSLFPRGYFDEGCD